MLLSESFLTGSVSAAWSFWPRPETSVNWGFSALLLPAVAAFGRNAVLLKAWGALLLGGGLWLFHRAARERFGAAGRLVFLAGLFLNDFSLGFSGQLISEAGYLFLFGLLCWLALARGWLSRGRGAELAGLGLLTAALIVTRTLGVVFLAAAAVELALSRRFKPALIYAGTALAACLPYFAAQKLLAGEFSYYPRYWAFWSEAGSAAFLSSLASNAWFYLKGLSSLTFLYLPPLMPDWAWLKAAAALLISGVALYGAARRSREPGQRLLAVYAALYFLVLSAWAYRAPRYALPLYPVFLLFLLGGLSALVPQKRRGLALGLFGILGLATNAASVARAVKASWAGPAEIPHRSHLWLKDHSAPEDLIVSMDISRIHYFAGRRGMHFVPSDSLESFVRRSRELKVAYFFLNEAGYVAASPGIKDGIRAQHDTLASYLSRKDLFETVHEDSQEGVRIYRLKAGKSGSSAKS